MMLPLLMVSVLAGARCEIQCLHAAAHSCCPAADGVSHVSATLVGATECSHPVSVLPWELVAPADLPSELVAVQALAPEKVQLRAELRGLPGTGPPLFPLRI